MTKQTLRNVLTTAWLLLIPTMPLSAQTRVATVTVSNTQRMTRTDEPVVIRLQSVNTRKFVARSAVVTCGRDTIPCQLDDTDGDGRADELAFVADFRPNETRQFILNFSAKPSQRTYPSRVYADLMLDDKKGALPRLRSIEAEGNAYIYNDLHHHGAAFESERVGYRIYFDKRQNIDLYGKRLQRLELADTHFYTTAQQLQQDYGNDVLWAGNRIGCGTLRPWYSTTWQTGRMGDWNEVEVRGQRIVAAGPVRTIVEMTDRGFEGMNVTTRYTLYAGHRDMQVDVVLDAPLKKPLFCTGVQKIGEGAALFRPLEGYAATWVSDYPEQSNEQMRQLFPPEAVGLAVYVPTAYVVSSREDDENCLLVIGKKGNRAFQYHVAFCAEKENDGFRSQTEWFAYMKTWTNALANPLRVRLARQVRTR